MGGLHVSCPCVRPHGARRTHLQQLDPKFSFGWREIRMWTASTIFVWPLYICIGIYIYIRVCVIMCAYICVCMGLGLVTLSSCLLSIESSNNTWWWITSPYMAAWCSDPTMFCLFLHPCALDDRIISGTIIYPEWRLLSLIHVTSCGQKNNYTYSCKSSRTSPNDANARHNYHSWIYCASKHITGVAIPVFPPHGQFASYTKWNMEQPG